MSIISSLASPYLAAIKLVDLSQPVLNLAFRLYLAKVFFYAGLTKIKTWSSTLMLFEYEYAVPFISFELAAYLATGVELLFPVLLVLGFAGRISAAALFILNYVAMISYPDISFAGINEHYFWGAMLAVLVIYGPGKLSIDAWLKGRFS